jgi:hypothetical protein
VHFRDDALLDLDGSSRMTKLVAARVEGCAFAHTAVQRDAGWLAAKVAGIEAAMIKPASTIENIR